MNAARKIRKTIYLFCLVQQNMTHKGPLVTAQGRVDDRESMKRRAVSEISHQLIPVRAICWTTTSISAAGAAPALGSAAKPGKTAQCALKCRRVVGMLTL